MLRTDDLSEGRPVPPPTTTLPLRVFICYSSRDSHFLNELETHLANLKRQCRIELCSDRDVEAGAVWESALLKLVDEANLILVLASSDLMHSDFMNNVMLERALTRHRQAAARVIPIVVRPVDIVGSSLDHLKALPPGGQPISAWKNRDEAWLSVVESIRALLPPTDASTHEEVAPTTTVPERTQVQVPLWRRFWSVQKDRSQRHRIEPATVVMPSLLLLLILMIAPFWKGASCRWDGTTFPLPGRPTMKRLSSSTDAILQPIGLTILWINTERKKTGSSGPDDVQLEQYLAGEVLPRLRALGAVSIVLDMALFSPQGGGGSSHAPLQGLLSRWGAEREDPALRGTIPTVVARIPSTLGTEWGIRPCEPGEPRGSGASHAPSHRKGAHDGLACFDWLIAFEPELQPGQLVACPDNSPSLALGISWMLWDLTARSAGPLAARLCTPEQLERQVVPQLRFSGGIDPVEPLGGSEPGARGISAPSQELSMSGVDSASQTGRTSALELAADSSSGPRLPFLELSVSRLGEPDDRVRHFVAGRVVLIGFPSERSQGLTRRIDSRLGVEISSAEATRFQAYAAAWLATQQSQRQ